MAMITYEDHGVRFEYPSEWKLEVTEDGPLTTIDLEHPDGVAFLLVSTDVSCPDPAEVADSALEAMREEYPDLESDAVEEMISDGYATGHDVVFFSLDLSNTARIRCFRTLNRTILVFGQWTDLVDIEVSDLAEMVLRSIEETED